MQSLSWQQVNRWRLAQHFLLERADRHDMLAVIERIGALQAQVMSAAKLQVWARVRDFDPEDVEQALWRDHTLIKSWVMRGTLHLVSARDFPLYVAGLSPALLKFYRRKSWLKYLGVSDLGEFDAIVEGVRVTLTETGMTRKQLAEAIAAHTGNPHLLEVLTSGWGMLLKPAAVQGHLCFGPSEGQNITFVQPRRWIGDWTPLDPEESLCELARRYLAAYAPATWDDFAHWYGMQPADAKRAFRALGTAITEVEIEGWKASALTDSLDALTASSAEAPVRLLPNFDPYVISASHHSQYILDEAHKVRVYRPQGWISPVVLVDGRIEGVWEYEVKRGQTVVTVSMFAPPDDALKQGIDAEAQRLGAYLGANSQLIFN